LTLWIVTWNCVAYRTAESATHIFTGLPLKAWISIVYKRSYGTF